MIAVSRREALNQGLKTYYTGNPCLNGHTGERRTDNGTCVYCGRQRTLENMRSNADRSRAYTKKYTEENQTKTKEALKSWASRNRAKLNASNAKREALKIQATPKWLSVEQLKVIESFYFDASSRGLTVDHQIPLRSKHVCGLHVPWNLQLLTKSENSSKGNRF